MISNTKHHANRKVFRIRWPIGVLNGRWQAYGNLLLATLPCQARYRLHSSSPLISVPDVANRWLHIVCKKKTGDNFGLCWGCVIGCLIPDLTCVGFTRNLILLGAELRVSPTYLLTLGAMLLLRIVTRYRPSTVCL